ncbi:MAG: deiodinase-related protein [Luteolibacter sp.]|jgi:hypothetical protein|nr:deiodinase-related protein [Luteolibacter sp.]
MRVAIACAHLAIIFLSNGCAIASRMGIQPPDRAGGPHAGETAPDFELRALDGTRWKLSESLHDKPVALILGSYSCPAFRGWSASLQELAENHRDEVQFLILYTVEAHPAGSASPYRDAEWLTSFNIREGIRLPQPASTAERLVLAGACRDALGLRIPMLPDTMDNHNWEAYGRAPNAAYLIGRDGRVALRQGWFHSGSFGKAINVLLLEERQ